MKNSLTNLVVSIALLITSLNGGIPASSSGTNPSEPIKLAADSLVSQEQRPELQTVDHEILLPLIYGREYVPNLAENQPPRLPSTPTPVDGETDTPLDTHLAWSGGDPDGDPVQYDVYIEANDNSPDLLISEDQSSLIYDLNSLAAGTTYYWQVAASDVYGSLTNGPIWSFTTAAGSPSNQPPHTPNTPIPMDGAVDQMTTVQLSWMSGDPDGDSVRYNLYLEAGDNSPDVLIADDQSDTSFDPGELSFATTYYWQIVAMDEHGLTTNGPVWNFTTLAQSTTNQPPYEPTLLAPANGDTNAPIDSQLTWAGGDPDGDPVRYDVFLEAGDSSPDVLVADDQIDMAFDPGGLSFETTYYWQVVAVDTHGATTEGPIWSFSTASMPPGIATQVAAGGDHTCALTSYGTVKCWGSNASGQLGDGTSSDRLIPGDVTVLDREVYAVHSGYNSICAIDEVNTGLCWGAITGIPVLEQITAVDLAFYHFCVVTEGGGVQCAGSNEYGQLGDGTNVDAWELVSVVGLTSGVAAVAVGGYHSCVLTASGGVKCWGWNDSGQLGDGTNSASNTPVDVVGLSDGVIAITAGAYHTCAVLTDGGLKCWGMNASGELGDGTNTARSLPVDVTGFEAGGIDSASAVSAMFFYTCALTESWGVKCWGENIAGQLGDGTQINRNTPVEVSGLASGVSAITTGTHHACAILDGGGLKCWGWNEHGQLGDGTLMMRLIPVDVVGFSGE